MDELDTRAWELNPLTAALLHRLIGTLAALYTTEPDEVEP